MAARSRATAWISLRQLADALDMSRSGAHRLLKRVPSRFVRRAGRRLEIYGPAAVSARMAPRVRRLLELDQLREKQAAADAEVETLLAAISI